MSIIEFNSTNTHIELHRKYSSYNNNSTNKKKDCMPFACESSQWICQFIGWTFSATDTLNYVFIYFSINEIKNAHGKNENRKWKQIIPNK